MQEKITCPNCGNPNATKEEDEFYPYQDEPYKGYFINCDKCGYCKEVE